MVLDACDGVATTNSVVTEVVEGTGQDRSTVCRWIQDGLNQLTDLGVLMTDERRENSKEPT